MGLTWIFKFKLNTEQIEINQTEALLQCCRYHSCVNSKWKQNQLEGLEWCVTYKTQVLECFVLLLVFWGSSLSSSACLKTVWNSEWAQTVKMKSPFWCWWFSRYHSEVILKKPLRSLTALWLTFTVTEAALNATNPFSHSTITTMTQAFSLLFNICYKLEFCQYYRYLGHLLSELCKKLKLHL